MAISNNDYAFIDFETQGKDPKLNQPVSMACVIIDGRRLKVKDNGVFYSLINIIDDDSVEKYNLAPLEKAALEKNGLTLDEIQKAPPLKSVWGSFKSFMAFHNPSRDKWKAPIFSGHNVPFDKQIYDRIALGHLSGHMLPQKLLGKTALKTMTEAEIARAYKELVTFKEPWKFGGENLVHPAKTIDTMQTAHVWFESLREPHRSSMDAIKEFLGFPSEGAHNALVDVLYTAEFFIRALKIQRAVSLDTDFTTHGQTFLEIEEILESYAPK